MAADPTIKLIEALIRCESITPNDAGCQKLIRKRLEGAGFACENFDYEDVSNLWAKIGTTGPTLCFAGHTDVVPPGDLTLWNSDPFEPVIKSRHMYGRGAADMKSGLAAMIVAAEQFLIDAPQFSGNIAFLITSDEEGDAINGTRKVVETLLSRGETIEWCVIGEPSSHQQLGDTIRIGRRGSLSGRLIIRGTQGHVAYPQNTDNPIRLFSPILTELLETTWCDGNAHFPPTNLEIVQLESGAGALNVIPPKLTATFNFRYSSEWNHLALQKHFTSIVERYDVDYELDWQPQGEPFLTAGGKLVDAATAAIQDTVNIIPKLSTAGGTSDGRFIAPAGAEVIELGPVNASIHKVNEHVRLEDLPRLVSMYQRIAENLLLTR